MVAVSRKKKLKMYGGSAPKVKANLGPGATKRFFKRRLEKSIYFF
jgi:hypothetical protein